MDHRAIREREIYTRLARKKHPRDSDGRIRRIFEFQISFQIDARITISGIIQAAKLEGLPI